MEVDRSTGVCLKSERATMTYWYNQLWEWVTGSSDVHPWRLYNTKETGVRTQCIVGTFICEQCFPGLQNGETQGGC